MMMLLALAAAAAVGVAVGWLLATAVQPGRQTSASALPPSEGRPRLDSALEELRHRYARGEIDREEYLQRKIDLETDWD
ncbi:SHOCT domain-containing protein [Nocardiopsis endophytica]